MHKRAYRNTGSGTAAGTSPWVSLVDMVVGIFTVGAPHMWEAGHRLTPPTSLSRHLRRDIGL